MALNADGIEEQIINDTLNVILKYEGDVAKAQSELSKILDARSTQDKVEPAEEEKPAEKTDAKKGILH